MKGRTPYELEALWKEKDMVDGKVVDTMVIIMRTNGCVWAKSGGCTMCGYHSASLRNVTPENLLKQLDQALLHYDGEPFVKIYTSGSFLDENEVPAKVRKDIFESFSECKRILFESRPEFVTEEIVSHLPSSTTIALGLESCNPTVTEKSIKKGFTPTQCQLAGELIKKNNLSVRSYLLLKPLFLQEKAAIEDTIMSAKFADNFSDEISINPVNVQRGTTLERIWKRGDYRTPWIWSLIEVMKQLSGTVTARLMTSPSGGGSQRGIHNCGKCDEAMLSALTKFSYSQDPKNLSITCECIEEWRNYMMSEVMLGTTADLDREFKSEMMIGGKHGLRH
ncbi:MAG: archaeosine biosynthesis radical SAM protein RaSEA [archaeon]|nr:archaeosine biosynthesis radical SAM protein RaSEA [archaeon]